MESEREQLQLQREAHVEADRKYERLKIENAAKKYEKRLSETIDRVSELVSGLENAQKLARQYRMRQLIEK